MPDIYISGESSQPKSEDTPEDNESGKRQRQSDPKQISDKQTAKRAKTQPKSLNHDESNKVEVLVLLFGRCIIISRITASTMFFIENFTNIDAYIV